MFINQLFMFEFKSTGEKYYFSTLEKSEKKKKKKRKKEKLAKLKFSYQNWS